MDIQTLEYMKARVEFGKILQEKINTAKAHIEGLKSTDKAAWMKIEFYTGHRMAYANAVFGDCENILARFAPVILAEYETELAKLEKKFAEL